MNLTVKWSDLDMSRASIMGLFDGKYIRAVTPLYENFMLAFGHDRHRSKIIYINQFTGQQYIKVCETDFQAKQIATYIAYELQEQKSEVILEKYGFELMR